MVVYKGVSDPWISEIAIRGPKSMDYASVIRGSTSMDYGSKIRGVRSMDFRDSNQESQIHGFL
jgi:hypothetical protein